MNKLNIRFTATSPNDQMRGLMRQSKLKTNEGALFIFGEPKSGNFWNKNVSFPIDVGFFDAKGKLLNVEKLMEEQRSPVFGAGEYKYVIEANLGWFKKNNVKIGTHYEEIIK